jgi:hypothetical protein
MRHKLHTQLPKCHKWTTESTIVKMDEDPFDFNLTAADHYSSSAIKRFKPML